MILRQYFHDMASAFDDGTHMPKPVNVPQFGLQYPGTSGKITINFITLKNCMAYIPTILLAAFGVPGYTRVLPCYSLRWYCKATWLHIYSLGSVTFKQIGKILMDIEQKSNM